jgi:hypothetical protein
VRAHEEVPLSAGRLDPAPTLNRAYDTPQYCVIRVLAIWMIAIGLDDGKDGYHGLQ